MRLKAGELHALLERERERGDVLVCWDAPLTGPWNPDNDDLFLPKDHTKRPLETFFTNKPIAGVFRVPKGISVLGYGGCPHWTITRRLLGLPRVGPYDRTDLPYELVADDEHGLRVGGAFIVEVHPALAIWLWCRRRMRTRKNWTYKKDVKLTRHLWQTVMNNLAQDGCDEALLSRFGAKEPMDDDELDVLVAWLLGALWSRRTVGKRGARLVRLMGNRNTGCMLLPNIDGLAKRFEDFRLEKT